MPNEKTDSLGFSTENSDRARDMGAKGGPTTTLGNPDSDHSIPTPASSDTQTMIAAAAGKKEKREKEEEEQRENRTNN